MENKYFNEAIIGNKEMIATFTLKGEMQRLYFPTRDNRQYIDFYHTGITVNNSDLIYLHSDINNVYKQYYDTDTNILNTEITNTYFNIKILQTDFIMLKENVVVRKYIFVNEGKIDLDVNFFIHSSLISSYNNVVGSKIIDSGVMQYAHDFTFSTFTKEKNLKAYKLNGTMETIQRGELEDKDYIGMAKDAGIQYEIGTIKPNEKQELEICILVDENKNISDIERNIERIKKIDINKEYTKAKAYWRKYVKDHNGLNIKEPKNSYEEKIFSIYRRSILLFPLLTNLETGGILASPEIDENRTKCGMYAYCWPRDGVFITKAYDILKMEKEVDKFYNIFCKKTQSKDGRWEQRFYTNGRLAPSWGYQIDETASVIYGVYEHYKTIKSEKFLKETLPMCEKAIDFLKRYTKDLFEETGKYKESYDLWEESEGTHSYSLASIYSAFEAMLNIYKILGKNVSNFNNNRVKIEKIEKNKLEIEKVQTDIKKFVNENLYDETKKAYVRNKKDKKMDISILRISGTI